MSSKQSLNEVFLGAAAEIVKKEAVHTYIIMPLNKSAYTVFDRDTLMDSFNAKPDENKSDMTDCDAIVAYIKNDVGEDWTWNYEETNLEKPAQFIGSLKGCIRDLVQKLDKENGQKNKYTVISRMYIMMEPDKLQNVVASANAFPAAEFLNKQGIELETASQRFLSEHMDSNWHLTDPRFQTVYFTVNDVDPDRPVDHEVEYEKQHEFVSNLIEKLVAKCWLVSVERGYIEGIQLVIKNRLFADFEGDAKRAVLNVFEDKYSTICKALATIANNNETDIMEKLDLSLIKINSIFSLMGFAQSYRDGKYDDIPEDREADEIALDEMDDYENHFYETIWDCLSEREANVIANTVINPLTTQRGWKIFGINDLDADTLNEDEQEVSPDLVKSMAPSNSNTPAQAATAPSRLLFGEGDSDWTKLKWKSFMSIGLRTAKTIEITERMFGGADLNYLIKDNTDPYKFNDMRTKWKSYPLLAIAYDMDFAAQYVNDYMKSVGINPGQVEGGEFGTLMFTSTFTNGSRLFADDQGRVFLKLEFNDDAEYPEDIATNDASLLSWCTNMFNTQSNPEASKFYTDLRNYLQIALKRWSDVKATILAAGAKETQVLDRFTVLMEKFPERKSPTDAVVAKFKKYIFGVGSETDSANSIGYNPMENLNKCIENLSKGNVTVV